tara:strand:+ start:1610 stop:4708 length:3099 start_codon:yes stop_codon:yes gene_type:complete
MNQFKTLNNYIGWSVFLLASFVYLSTIEQTVSFWDCGEYIATANKLQVGHPPGAPFFQLFGRIFSLFATQGTSEVAVAVNMMSALCSSFTILFLFWTITAFGRRLFLKNEEVDFGKMIAVLGSGMVGSLAYTFSDSFWFSAVEGEVYAMSSLFTAVTFWCIMKWEEESKDPKASRWLVLIGYLIGLSVGVHLLSLLTIPAMGMIYYFKKYNYTRTGAIKAFFTSMAILGLVQGIIIPGAVSLISKFELFFVNTIGLPFNSGTIIYFLTIIISIVIGIIYTKKRNKPIWNTAILTVMMLLIGYSSFAILVVRSNANPPIDENNPEDAVGLLSYLKREQYGSWPIVYGQHFNAKLDSREPYIDGNPIYAKDEKKGKYVIIDRRKNTVPNYSKKDKMLFPRIWSATQARHAEGYVNWAGLKNKDVSPTFAENLTFFFRYQIGWSYLRYFMWNFAGRQNDYMNMDGNSLYGNWESGINFIDNARLGSPSSDIVKPNQLENNKGKNHYFFLPLILGLIGMLFHFKKNNQDALAVLLFFLFTGVLIIIYLNVVPFQPRERDYAYVGSFYAFSIWIGLGVLAIYDVINKNLNSKTSASLATLIALLIPAIMAAENWDDHDRSGRFTALEVAKNYLNSCDENAILFTNGDNDTFPLWYAQEIEGVRTDIKVVNLSLFNTDWYIDQMKRASYEAPPIPSSLEHDDYRTGTRDYTPIQERFNEHIEVKKVVGFINSSSPKSKLNTSAGLRNYCPTKKLKLTVNKEIAKTFVPEEHQNKIVDEIKFRLKGSGIFKNKLMVLDILANFNWERPIYFAITVGRDNYMGLQKYFQLEGLAYRLVPYSVASKDGQTGIVHTEKMYERLMNKFEWGGLNNPDLYFDETNTRMVMNFRNNYSRLAESLYQKAEKEKAIAVLDKCMDEFPGNVVNLSYFSIPIVDLYYKLGEVEKGNEVLAAMIENQLNTIKYLKEFDRGSGLKQEIGITGQVLSSLARILQIHKLENPSYTYLNEDGTYYRQKDLQKEEIDFNTYRINTFMDEYLTSIQ